MNKLKKPIRWLANSYPVKLIKAYGESQSSNFASGLAFNMLISAFPLMLGILSLVGLFINNPSNRTSIEHVLLGFFPPDSEVAIRHALDGVHQHSGILGLVGIIGLLWSGSSLFASMEFALDEIYSLPQRNFIKQRLMALAMTLIFSVGVVVPIGTSALLGPLASGRFVVILLGAVVWTCLSALILMIVPNRVFTFGEAWRGALLTGVILELLSLVWPLYAKLAHGFNSYGSAFALFFVLAAWLYLISQALLLGAVVNKFELNEHTKHFNNLGQYKRKA